MRSAAMAASNLFRKFCAEKMRLPILSVVPGSPWLIPNRSRFYEPDRKGGYGRPIDKSRGELVRDGLKMLKGEVRLWQQEMKEKLEDDPLLLVRPGEVDVVWKFEEGSKCLEPWITASDSDHGEGSSSCSLSLSPLGKALFQGQVTCKVPKDGRVKRAGYCNIRTLAPRRSFKRDAYLDWQLYSHLVLNLRGDGRTYLLNIATAGYFDITWNDVYHYVLHTRGGPYWQLTKIPFSRFFLSSKGRVQDKQHPIPLDRVSAFGISVGGRPDGDFRLEVDYVGVEFDPTHVEEFAYEMYQVPRYISGV